MYMLDITASAIVLNQLFNFSEDALQGKTNPPSNFAVCSKEHKKIIQF